MIRVASLLPSATEIVCALGAGEALVGVSHECDYPLEIVRVLPKLTRSAIPPGLAAREVDALVAERARRGEALYEIEVAALSGAAPDVIVTQGLCDVCAVSETDVRRVAAELPGSPRVVSLDATSLGGVLDDVERVAVALGLEERGRALGRDLAERLENVEASVAGKPRPRVVALEWLDPPFAAGHWVPEMVAKAGGEEVLGSASQKSFRTTWDAVEAARPDVLLVVPCGYDLEAARAAAATIAESRLVGAVHALDATSLFSRPGPRLVDGVEALASLLHGRDQATTRTTKSPVR